MYETSPVWMSQNIGIKDFWRFNQVEKLSHTQNIVIKTKYTLAKIFEKKSIDYTICEKFYHSSVKETSI